MKLLKIFFISRLLFYYGLLARAPAVLAGLEAQFFLWLFPFPLRQAAERLFTAFRSFIIGLAKGAKPLCFFGIRAIGIPNGL